VFSYSIFVILLRAKTLYDACSSCRDGEGWNSYSSLCSLITNVQVVKSKAIPVTGRGDPQGCETFRVPHYLDSRFIDGVKFVSLTRRPHFTPQEIM
jgi:hypothetical protein